MLITFATSPASAADSAVSVVRVASWLLGEKFPGCAAEVLAHNEDGSRVTVSLGMTRAVQSVDCFEWFTQYLADHALTLVRDDHFERAIAEVGRAR